MIYRTFVSGPVHRSSSLDRNKARPKLESEQQTPYKQALLSAGPFSAAMWYVVSTAATTSGDEWVFGDDLLYLQSITIVP